MKYLMLLCEGMADEPVEALGNRTPLEVAKTPFMNLMAKEGRVGAISFTPRSLPPAADVACLSCLGFDPLKYYTGIAPLAAAAMGISQTDREIAFRCDFVTALDDVLIDTRAGNISDTESRRLIGALNEKLSGEKARFYPGRGYQNLLLIRNAEKVEELDELDCVPPAGVLGKKFAKYLPKGRAQKVVRDLIQRSREILEGQEINRVRIDLKENPANMIWLWGQGRVPRLPSFRQHYGMAGTAFSQAGFAKGLARTLGLEVAENLSEAIEKGNFVFVYHAAQPGQERRDLKEKIGWIEHFDAGVVGHAYKTAQRSKDTRIFVSSDTVESLSRGGAVHGQVPFLLYGKGVEPAPSAFHEKSAAESRWRFDAGHEFMGTFLK